jgi:peptide/nickel transport system substrate-binding protein
MIDNIGSGVVQYEPGTSNIVGDLAKNWTISQDGRTYTFNLRTGAQFSNGDPVTAQTVKFSWVRAMAINGPSAGFLSDYVNKSDPNSIVVTSQYQIVVHLMQPFAPFLSILALSGAPAYVVDPKLASPNAIFNGTYVGSGRYMVTKFTPGVELDLTANPKYYGSPPATPNIVIKFFSDSSTLAIAVQSREIDVALGTLFPSDIPLFKANPNLKVWEGPGGVMRLLQINNQIPPFDQLKVRQAITYAINRTAIISSVFLNTVTPAYSIVPKGLPGELDTYNTAYGPDGNLTRAKQLLSQLGYNSTHKLSMDLWYTPTSYGTTEVSVVTLIQQQLQSTGMITVTLHSAEFQTYLSLFLGKKNLPTFMQGWFPDYVDADDYVNSFYNSFFSHYTGAWYNNTQVDQLLKSEQASTNPAQRIQYIQQIQKLATQDAVLVPLWQAKQIVVTQNYVSGVILDVSQVPHLWTLYAPNQ